MRSSGTSRPRRPTRLAGALPGILVLALVSCDLTEPSPVPTTLVVIPGEVWLDAFGATRTLSILVRSQAGERIQGVSAEWTSADPEIVSVSEKGTTRAEGAGSTTITARVGDLTATATVRVEPVARRIELLAGDGQAERAGRTLPEPVRIRVTDRLGTPLPGAEVEFAAANEGTASPASAVADADGLATTHWTLGPEPGTQSLAVTVGVRHTFHLIADAEDDEGRVPFRIRLRFLTDLDPAVRQAFEAAAARWEPFFQDKLAPVLVRVPGGRCGDNAPPLDEVVDDLLVLVTAEPIDGPGGVAALAAPCFLRQEGLLPIVGQVRVDAEDLDALAGLGLLEDLATHEIGHVLGIGALWELFELLEDPSLPDARGADTHFSGPRAVAGFDEIGGTDYLGAKVPVENEEGGDGTRDRHWRQAVLRNELMTSFLSATGGNPLSRVTLGSLEDLGYVVDVPAAEPFALDLAAVAGLREGQGIPPREGDGFPLREARTHDPFYLLDPEGRVVRILHRR